jgi:hypothetical protein
MDLATIMARRCVSSEHFSDFSSASYYFEGEIWRSNGDGSFTFAALVNTVAATAHLPNSAQIDLGK